MESIFQEEMSDQEFQFCKEQLKSNVKTYLEIDDQIKAWDVLQFAIHEWNYS